MAEQAVVAGGTAGVATVEVAAEEQADSIAACSNACLQQQEGVGEARVGPTHKS